MHIDQFDFILPDSLIAKTPAEPRDHSRLMVIDRPSGDVRSHQKFFELENLIRPGDCLVLNNTKVLPARLYGESQEGKQFEVFLLKSVPGDLPVWDCLVKPGKKVGAERTLRFPEGIEGVLRPTGLDGFRVEFPTLDREISFLPWLFRAGQPPLPPYLKRKADSNDVSTYQTVYAKAPGSVAAPTAGLHFTPELLGRLKKKQIEIQELTLHVGYGTFSPIRVDSIEDHQMHEEFYEITEATRTALDQVRKNGGRVIAVGTTSLRALESYGQTGQATGSTSIFIRPGYQFTAIDGLITNFHLPRSSLFILVSALIGLEPTQRSYLEAIRENYRFYSYGDAMLIL